MSFQKEEKIVDEIARMLGMDDAFGFHLDMVGQQSLFWDGPPRGDGTRFPCIDDQNRYSGCLGARCTAKRCWAGELVPSAVKAAGDAPLPSRELQGAACHACRHAVDIGEGQVDCEREHFNQPITVSCLVRRRVPESVPVPCPDFGAAITLRSEVQEYRARKRDVLSRYRARSPRHRSKPGRGTSAGLVEVGAACDDGPSDP